MNKFLLSSLVVALTLPAGVFAAQRERADIPRNAEKFELNRPAPGETLGYIQVGNEVARLVVPPVSPKSRADEPPSMPITPVIYKAPGTAKRYTKDVEAAFGYYTPYLGLYGIADVINWDGDDAYIKNIATIANNMNTYVKATLQGDVLVLPMNQTVYEFDDFEPDEEEYAVNMGLLRPLFSRAQETNELMLWYEFSNDYPTLSYSVSADGVLTLTMPERKYDISQEDAEIQSAYRSIPPYAVGYYYNNDLGWNGWLGYCDLEQVYYPFNYEAPVIPDGLTWNTFTYINGQGLGVIAQVAETEDNVYVKGLSAYLPGATFMAEKIENGTKMQVPNGQFIGVEYGLYYVITNIGEMGFVQGRPSIVEAPQDEMPTFILNRDENGKLLSIEADPDLTTFLVFDDDPGYFYDMDSFPNLVLTAQDEFNGTPCTPTEVSYYNYTNWLGANFIFFQLSPFADNGDIINTNKLYYSVFVNGDPVEFEQTEGLNLKDEEIIMYKGINKPTMLVPYHFANDIDLYEDSGGTFIVGLYVEGIETVGVEAVYTGGDEITISQLVTIDVETGEQTITEGSNAKVESLKPEIMDSSSVYNLQGMKVNPDNLNKGSIYIINGKKVFVK